MIGTSEIKIALNRLAAAYGNSKDPSATLANYEDTLKNPALDITPAELSEAVSRYIAKTENSYGFPTPAAIRAEVMAYRTPGNYREEEPDDRPSSEYIRNAWARHLDLDELRAANKKHKRRVRDVS